MQTIVVRAITKNQGNDLALTNFSKIGARKGVTVFKSALGFC